MDDKIQSEGSGWTDWFSYDTPAGTGSHFPGNSSLSYLVKSNIKCYTEWYRINNLVDPSISPDASSVPIFVFSNGCDNRLMSLENMSNKKCDMICNLECNWECWIPAEYGLVI